MGKYEANGNPSDSQSGAVRPTAQQIASRKKAIKHQRIVIITACSLTLVLLLALIIGLVVQSNQPGDDGKILPNVYAGGINLGGMTREEAISALHLATDSTLSKKDMVITVANTQLNLSPVDTKASLDVAAAVDAAYNYGRNGSEDDYRAAKKAAASTTHTVALLPYMTLDLDYIEAAITQFCNANGSTLTQPSVELSGSRPAYDPEYPNLAVPHQTLTVTMGTPDYILSASRLYDRALDAYSLNQLAVEYNAPTRTEPNAPNAEQIFGEYCASAVNANIDDITYEVTPEVYGYGFEISDLQKKLDAAGYGQAVTVELNFIMPQVTAKDLTENLFVDLLASYTCDHPSGSTQWLNNMTLAAQALNGIVIKADSDFSLNLALGRPTAQKGYQLASEYSGGRLTEVLGGGINQVASALYYCALMADLGIMERNANPYAVSYIGLGLDAYVDWGNQDLRLKNNTDAPIRITTEVVGSAVTVRLFGDDTRSYTASIQTDVVGETLPDTVIQIVARDNVYGYTAGQVIQTGIIGYEVQTSMDKIDKETGERISSTLVDTSYYGKQDQVVIQIEGQIPETEAPDDVTHPPEDGTANPEDPTSPSDGTEEPTKPSDGTLSDTTEESTNPSDGTSTDGTEDSPDPTADSAAIIG